MALILYRKQILQILKYYHTSHPNYTSQLCEFFCDIVLKCLIALKYILLQSLKLKED